MTAAAPLESDDGSRDPHDTAKATDGESTKERAAARFAHQAKRLSLRRSTTADRTTAVGARFITPRDPVIETATGDRLPAVPLVEAQKLNQLKNEIQKARGPHGVGDAAIKGSQWKEKVEDANDEVRDPTDDIAATRPDAAAGSEVQKEHERRNEAKASAVRARDRAEQEAEPASESAGHGEDDAGPVNETEKGFERMAAPLAKATPPSHTNPLFPPLPLHGPPSPLRTLQCWFIRFTSFWFSLFFLMIIVVGSAVTSVPLMLRHMWLRLQSRDPDERRPFYEDEKRRRAARRHAEAHWTHTKRRRASLGPNEKPLEESIGEDGAEFIPTEGGPDLLQPDVAYYARRVGLDIEEFKVQTEDGFVITLWHVYNPLEYTPATDAELQKHKPEVFPEHATYDTDASPCGTRRRPKAPKRYPVLLIHGLLQSAGAFCCNDDDSLAFYLAKSGYDVWLGNNRCGFKPEHTLLKYGDPRMWCFNIRQMGVFDLPALISRVLTETGFPKLGLVCHSQGTTQTFVALAKDQRPDLGQRISVFCALAPAVYAGPLIGKFYFKFMKVISPAMFRILFGMHAFIPFMMTMHAILPRRLYGAIGYRVFSFMFEWTDDRWEMDFRDRQFQFAPVYVSAECMRWWLGRECFAKHRCILATREDGRQEDAEDAADVVEEDRDGPDTSAPDPRTRAWYDDQAPPMALWVAGSDRLVDGDRLLRRFARGREPDVTIVHAAVIAEYEHLDVLWAMDAVAKVGREVKETLWQTAEHTEGCAVPTGCAELERLH